MSDSNKITQKQRKIADNIIEMKNVIVPVIGEEVFYAVADDGHHISMQEYLLDCFMKEYGAEIDRTDIETIINSAYYGLSKLECIFESRYEADYIADFRSYIKKAIQNDRIKMLDSIYYFLKVFSFPLIVTTSCFPFIENILSDLHYHSQIYSPKGNNEMAISSSQHIVYHLFGMVADGAKWVYDENQLLEFLHYLHNQDTTSKNLKKYIDSKSCRLLILGCNLPDWLFRFLWYPIKCDKSDRASKSGYWIHDSDITESFNNFLSTIQFVSAREVDIILRLASEKMNRAIADITENDKIYDGFLSYASEDMVLARRIHDILSQRGYNIWFDKGGNGKIEVGSNYMKKIEDGVKRSRHYIPLITDHFLEKICNPESNLRKEMNIAKAHAATIDSAGTRYSMPVIVENRTLTIRL